MHIVTHADISKDHLRLARMSRKLIKQSVGLFSANDLEGMYI